MKRGAFIVLEGLDRSGKTTQTAKLVQRLQNAGHTTKLLKFPGIHPLCMYVRVLRSVQIEQRRLER